MRKTSFAILALVGVATLACASTPAAAQGASRGVAISSANTVHYAWGDTDNQARAKAVAKCREEEGRRNCPTSRVDEPDPKAIGIKSWWAIVFALCDGDRAVAGTQWADQDKGMETIRDKVGGAGGSCEFERMVAGVPARGPVRAQGR